VKRDRSPSAGPRAGLPPGLQLIAEVPGTGGKPVQIRLLGDESRGFLLVGGPGFVVDDDQEIWFATLEEAIGAGERLGARAEDWIRMSAPADVRG
jgi:hypothetical protein